MRQVNRAGGRAGGGRDDERRRMKGRRCVRESAGGSMDGLADEELMCTVRSDTKVVETEQPCRLGEAGMSITG